MHKRSLNVKHALYYWQPFIEKRRLKSKQKSTKTINIKLTSKIIYKT